MDKDLKMDKNIAANPVVAYFDSVAEFYDNESADYSEEQLEDLDEAHEQISTLLAGHRILELGCGTGGWTEVLAETAESIVAVDASAAMLEQARTHGEAPANVTYLQADALDLPADLGNGDAKFTAVFMAGLWSHLTRDQQDVLLAGLKKRVGKDVLLVLFDDEYVEGESATIARTDLQGNTYEILQDADGNRHELPKGYPTDSALRKKLGNAGREIKIARWEFYRVLTCRLK